MIRILIAEDHAIVRSGIKNIIAVAGDMLVAGEATQGDEVLAMVRSLDFDVLLLDLTMPRLDGFEALQRMKALRPEVRVLLSSGFAEPGMERRIPPGSVAGFLPKPYRVQDLIAAVKASLEA